MHMEKSPQPTTETKFRTEYDRNLKDGEVYSASPTTSTHDRYKINREYAERHKKNNIEKRQIQDKEHQKAYEEILSPANIIKLKHQTVGPNLTLKDIRDRIASAEAHKATTPKLEDWKPGRIKGAEARIDQLNARIEEIKAGLDELTETYLDGFDPEGTLPINDEFRAELEKMLSLSFKELKELAENPGKTVSESDKKEETTTKEESDESKEEEKPKTEEAAENTPETDTTSPEMLQAQKLASVYWQKRLENNLEYLKDPQPGSSGQDFDIAYCTRALQEIEAGNFFEDFKFEGPYDGEVKSGESKSIYQFFKDLVDHGPAYIAWLEANDISDKERHIKESRELAAQAAEIVAAIDAIGSKPEAKPKKGPKSPNTPITPDYRAQAEKAAKASAKAYEKSPARAEAQQRDEEREQNAQHEAYRLQAEKAAKDSAEAYARTKAAEALAEFNRDWEAHQKKLKDEQDAVRQRVEAEEEAERKRLKDEKEQREATEQGLEAARLQKLTAIEDAANKNKKGKDGKKRSRADRITELHALALKYSGQKGPGDIDDLGMEVVKKMSKAVFYNKLDPRRFIPTPNQKDALYTLRMMANAGNKTAEQSMPWVRLTRTRSVNKARLGTQREIKRKSKK